MLSWSSKGGTRLLPAAAVVILFLFWSFTYWDVPFDTVSLRRPWSNPEPELEYQEQGHSDFAYLDDGSTASPVAVEDPFFKQYHSTEGSLSEVADRTEPLLQPSPTSTEQTDTLLMAISIAAEQKDTLLLASSTSSSLIDLTTSSLQLLSNVAQKTPTPRAEVATTPSSPPSPNHSSSDSDHYPNSQLPDVPLILYAYYETPDTRPNLQFFVSHALHANAKFIFIFNGETDAELLLPTNESNIHYVKRNNTCFDLGAYAEILKSNDSALIRQHKRFIIINASLRGPFVPFWSRDCWSDAYLDKLNDEVKLVGMTMNCRSDLPRHVQSMILATDSLGLATLLTPDGIDNCPQDMNQAVAFETRLTSLIKANGYTVGVIMAMGNSYDGWVDVCANGDVTVAGAYDGTNIHPYETMFVKTKRGADPKTLELLTKWHDGSNYSSYNYC
jgi:hypothetical protein